MKTFEFNVKDFDKKIHDKAEEIILKFDREVITSAEMLLLGLNAQNKSYRKREMSFSHSSDYSFNNSFDRLFRFLRWQAGIMIALFAGLYIKLFLG